MKKIVIDARESGTSTGRYIDKLIEYLHGLPAASKYSFVILVHQSRLEFMKSLTPNFTVQTTRFKKFTFGEQLGFARQLYRLKADLVHFPMVQQPILYQKAVVTTFQDLTTLRFMNTAQNKFVFRVRQYVYKWVNIIAARKSRALITPTEFVKEDVAKFTRTNSRKITVTLEAVDDFDEAAEPVPDFEGKKFIMFNGRPQPHKNLQRLIEAFAILHEHHPDLYLMIAGKKDRSHRGYIKLVDSLGLADRVVLTDFIPDGQLKWAMQNTQAYVYPSLSEGFGLPPLEAMLNGAPVVASNATCIPEVCGNAAHYFNPESVEEMAEKINDVLVDSQLRDKLIAAGKRRVTMFSWKRMAEETLDVYRQVLHEE